jgi:uncharacterized protein
MPELDGRYPRHQDLWDLMQADVPRGDLAHDREHLGRVYAWSLRLAGEVGADCDLAGAAALMHDLINLPKESAARAAAGERSARASVPLLEQAGYQVDEVEQIAEAVRTSSWSRGLAPTSALGRVLQDADRLDAIGAIGIARTLTSAQAMAGRGKSLALYDPDDPLAAMGRDADDGSYAIDHFMIKLLNLAAGMHLPAARAEAARRQRTMLAFLEELAREVT